MLIVKYSSLFPINKLHVITIHDWNNDEGSVNEDSVGQMKSNATAHRIIILHIAHFGRGVTFR